MLSSIASSEQTDYPPFARQPRQTHKRGSSDTREHHEYSRSSSPLHLPFRGSSSPSEPDRSMSSLDYTQANTLRSRDSRCHVLAGDQLHGTIRATHVLQLRSTNVRRGERPILLQRHSEIHPPRPQRHCQRQHLAPAFGLRRCLS